MLHYIEFRAMGCQATIQIETDADVRSMLDQIPAHIEVIEAQLSRFRPESDLVRFNAQAGRWVTVSEVLFENISVAKHAALLTEGLYNPLVLPALIASGYDRTFEQLKNPETVPATPIADWHDIALRVDTREVCIPVGSALDLGGIAKGWTASSIAEELSHYGACLVNMGGDMTARGAPEGFPGWEVEIEDPFTGAVFITLWLRDTSIATSGIDYRRWKTADGQQHHHIIDPRTGRPAITDAITATVIHKHAPTAEAYAKAVLLRGAEEGLKWLNQQWYADGMVFRRDGAVLATTNLNDLIYE